MILEFKKFLNSFPQKTGRACQKVWKPESPVIKINNFQKMKTVTNLNKNLMKSI
jgi:hypothetical protein